MALTALIFDFDGLLVDTESTMVASWQQEWRYHGLELDLADDFLASHGGDVSEQRYARLAAAVGPSFDRAESHARRLAHREKLHADLDLAPGIRDLMAEAEQQRLRLAVASSASRQWVTGLLDQLGVLERFDSLAFGDEVATPKPDPAVYLLALDRLGVDAAQAVALEDTPHGVHAAVAAGLRCVAIPNRFLDPTRFGHATWVRTSAAELRLADLQRD